MAEILGLGVTHSPPLLGTDERMAGILERVMRSPHVPAAVRDPSGWPAPMQQEWAEHQAGRLAGPHRQRLIEAFRAVRAALDAFNPDIVLIWGDDQYENFREDGVAPFCVFALDTIESRPFARLGKAANAWGEPNDTVVRHARPSRRRPLSDDGAGGARLRHALCLYDAARGGSAACVHQCTVASGLRSQGFALAGAAVPCELLRIIDDLQARRVRAYRRHRLRRARSAWSECGALLRRRRGNGAGVAGVAVAGGGDRIVELVALVSRGDQSLCLARHGSGSRAVRGDARRSAGIVEGPAHDGPGASGPAGDAELGVPGRGDGRAGAAPGVERVGRDVCA